MEPVTTKILLGSLILAAIIFLLYSAKINSTEYKFPNVDIIEIENKYGKQAALRFKAWLKIMQEAKSLPTLEKLEKVNLFFNLINPSSDSQTYGVLDYWATPWETLINNAADCDDYVIAKYLTLRAAGIPENKLEIVYATLLTQDQGHMVLAYYETPDSIPLILDNVNGKILPADKRPDLQPVYSFNADGLWRSLKTGDRSKIGEANSLNQWRSLQERLLQGIP